MTEDTDRSGRRVLRLSVHTERALAAHRPLLRGVSHLVAAIVALPFTLVWTTSVEAGPQRWGVLAFTAGVSAMFCASALLHLRRWPPRIYERFLRLDHTGIYCAISGTGIALGLLAVRGWPGVALIVGACVGGIIGIVLEWLPFAPPRGFSNTVYLTLGWLPVVLLPWLWRATGPVTVALLVAGGALYTSGAVIVGLRRPDPLPRWFGYHELFHLMVIVAVVLHAVMFVRLT